MASQQNKRISQSHLPVLNTPTKRRKKDNENTVTAINEHQHILNTVGTDTVITYTDGSASPNPGASGAGVSIFFQNPDTIVDCGTTLGHGTNNSAELYALGVCCTELRKLFLAYPHIKRAVIFSDSQLALKAATASTRPLTNSELTIRLRKAYTALLITKRAVDLHWNPGHAGLGGNERADKLSKSYATNTSLVNSDNFTSNLSNNPWLIFPLSNVPLSLFSYNLPVPRRLHVIVDDCKAVST